MATGSFLFCLRKNNEFNIQGTKGGRNLAEACAHGCISQRALNFCVEKAVNYRRAQRDTSTPGQGASPELPQLLPTALPKGLLRTEGQKGLPDLSIPVPCRQKCHIIPFFTSSCMVFDPTTVSGQGFRPSPLQVCSLSYAARMVLPDGHILHHTLKEK